MLVASTTAVFAAVLALVYAALSMWVIAGRFGKNALFGDAGDDGMMRRIRSHANFIEYVPLALILIAFLETSGASHALVVTLLVLLTIARLLHPVGMLAPTNTPRQFACRGGSVVVTIGILVVAAVALLIKLA